MRPYKIAPEDRKNGNAIGYLVHMEWVWLEVANVPLAGIGIKKTVKNLLQKKILLNQLRNYND